MMKKYWQYIKCTLLYRFSKDIQIGKSAKIKWIKYSIKKRSGNKLIFEDCCIFHCSFKINGLNNKIVIDENANIGYCSFSVVGDNNEIHISGSTGIMTITLRGKGCSVQIGKQTSIESCYMVCMGENNSINIGDDCMFSGNIEIWNSDTHLITDLMGNGINPSQPIVIGNHVWLGKSVKVLKGTTIGDGSIAGMNSIVTKDIPPHSIAAGNPAKVIKTNVNWTKGFINI